MENFNIHNLLKVSTDIEGLVPDMFSAGSNSSYRPDLKILKGISQREGLSVTVAQGQRYYESSSSLWNRFKFFGLDMSSLYMSKNRESTLFLSEPYVKFGKYIPMPISGFYPLEHLVKLYMQVELLKKDYSFLISGAFEYATGKAALICGPIGVGKTTTTFGLLAKSDKFRFLGDDTLITDGNEVLSYPRMVRLRKFGNAFFSANKHLSPIELVGKERIVDRLVPEKVFFLERSSANCIEKTGSREALARFRALNNKILSLHIERLLSGCMYLGLLDGMGLDTIHDEVLERLINKVSSFYTVRADNLERSTELIYEKSTR